MELLVRYPEGHVFAPHRYSVNGVRLGDAVHVLHYWDRKHDPHKVE